MSAILRPFGGETDLRAMAALAREFPSDHLHVVDLPYRFSSWALDDPDNAALWLSADGKLLAWAVLQTPFWTIDYALHREAGASVFRQLLDWADGRARDVLATPSGRPAWYVNVLATQTERLRDLEEAGYASQAHTGEDSWSKVLMQRLGQAAIPQYNLLPGFAIRPLAGDGEVEAYVELHRAAFGSKNMTVAWRRRTLHRDEYMPELDLVAVAPAGQLAGFCIGWFAPDVEGQAVGQVEPLGVHPEWRGYGLGRALLAEVLRQLQQRGAVRMLVETDSYRDAAFALYESAGFRVAHDVVVSRKDEF